MKKLKFLIIVFLTMNLFSCDNEKPLTSIVTIGDGTIEGVVENGINVYKGIPYAAPPVGDLRWKEPQPVISWDGVLKTTKFAPGSIQNQNIEQSEDCLYLNVWSQAKTTKDKLPVMVWIHGGGFNAGAPLEATYFGENLTNKGVIYVSIAYRLGVLGFLAHPDLSTESPNKVSGNYGILDMIASLKWVQKNISAFGGDPNNVTIFGESAGGIAVSILCASPLSKNLFKGAISQSGGNFQPVNESSMLTASEEKGIEFMEAMGAKSIDELREIKNFNDFFNYNPTSRTRFWPIVDNYVLNGDQYNLYESGKYNDVNVLIGWNSDEGALFTREIEPEAYVNNIKTRYGSLEAQFIELYPGDTKEKATRSSSELIRDQGLGYGTWTWGKLQSRTGKSKVFMYYFDQRPPLNSQLPSWVVGAPHAEEIKYTLENIDPNFYGDDDLNLSNMMGTYWTNFAKYGDPNGVDLPLWDNFSEESPKVMYFKNTSEQRPELKEVPNINKMELFEQYYKSIRNQVNQ